MESSCLLYRDEDDDDQSYRTYGLMADMRPQECGSETSAMSMRRNCLSLFEALPLNVEGMQLMSRRVHGSVDG